MNTEQLGLELRKTSPDHQRVYAEMERVLRPSLDHWSRTESLKRFGIDVGVRYAWVVLSRKLWRAVVVGQTFAEARVPSSVSWQRFNDKLLGSIFRDADADRSTWQSTRFLEEVRGPEPKPTLLERACSRLPLPLSDLPASLQTDRPALAFGIDLVCAVAKQIHRPRAKVVLFLDLLSREFRSLLATGILRSGWSVVSLKREPYPACAPLASNEGPVLPELKNVSPLTAYLIQDAIRTWAETQPAYWAAVRTELRAIESRLGHAEAYALWGHADLSTHYLARASACEKLRIPVIETQHGAYFSRYEHVFGLSCQTPTDIHVGFGLDTSNVPKAHAFARGVAGEFFRTRLVRRHKRRRRSAQDPIRVVVGSYYLMDFDECEFIGDDGELLAQEIEGIRRLAADSRFQVDLKIRPRAHGSVYGFLDEATRANVRIVSPHEKAGQPLLSKYDVTVTFHYSSVLLEAGSIGAPVAFCPPASERNQLRPEFVHALQESPNEVRLCDTDRLVESVAELADTTPGEQAFSLNYCRYATPERLRTTARDLEKAIRDFQTF